MKMKTIRTFMTLAGLCVALVALGATSASAAVISFARFTGSFTLPTQAQWGPMTLPAGNYSLYYGRAFNGGTNAVEVVNRADGSVRGTILVEARNDTSAHGNALVCTREGNVDIVRALDLPALGESLNFALPHGAQVVARLQNHKPNTALKEEASLSTERVPAAKNQN
jgi:hypothetical protein